jgi:hypothetical protein
MDLQFSVFNGHVNDADKRARELMKTIASDWLEEVEKIEKEGDGIMAIFNTQATLASICYASIVAAYVNERSGDIEMPPIGTDLTVYQLAAIISSKIPTHDKHRDYKIAANHEFANQLHSMVKTGGVWGWPATATIWEITEDGFRRTA